MGPIYNRIHLGLGISPELPPQNDSVANSLFSGPIFDPKNVPGPKCRPEIQKSDPGFKIPPPGMKNQKMRAEKPYRIQSSEFQTEPYAASYGPKTFLKGHFNKLGWAGWPSLRGGYKIDHIMKNIEKTTHVFSYFLGGAPAGGG